MKYNVNIIAAAVVQAMSSKPEVFGSEGSEMRSADGHIFHKSAIVYTNENGNTLVNTGLNVNFVADKVLYKDGCYRFILEDGSKASFYSGRGVDIEITEVAEAEAEEEEEEAPAPKKKKAAAVVEDDEEEEIEVPLKKKKAAAVVDDEDDFAPPVRGKKAAPVVEEEEEEAEEEEAPAPKKKKAAAVVEDDEEEEIEVQVKKPAKKGAVGKVALEWDDSEFDS